MERALRLQLPVVAPKREFAERNVMREAGSPGGGALLRAACRLLLAVTALCPVPVLAQSVVVDRSEIRFFTKQLGVVVEGRFRKWSADLDFRSGDPAHSHVSFAIDLGSIDFASDEAENEMRRPGWFDTVKFPLATFVSTAVRDLGGDRYEVAGRFTLKGQTQDLVVPVRLAKEGNDVTVARGEFMLKRLQFMVGDGPWNDTSVVADDVLVRVRLTLSRAANAQLG
jgi:polyisoprenoid-binding protein YceI